MSGMRHSQMVVRAVEGAESPHTTDGCDDFGIKSGGLQQLGFNGKPATHRIRLRGNVQPGTLLRIYMQDEVVRELRRENERSAIRLKQKRRLPCTEHLILIHSAKRRRRSGMYRRKSDHQNRLWIAKRRRVVKPQVEIVVLRQGECGNVLILSCVCRRQNPGDIDNRSNVRAIVTTASGWRGADLCQRVGRRAGG